MTPRWWRLLLAMRDDWIIGGGDAAAAAIAKGLQLVLVLSGGKTSLLWAKNSAVDSGWRVTSRLFMLGITELPQQHVVELSQLGIEKIYLVGANAVGVQTTAKRLQAAGATVTSLGSADRHRAFLLQVSRPLAPLPHPIYELRGRTVTTTASAFCCRTVGCWECIFITSSGRTDHGTASVRG